MKQELVWSEFSKSIFDNISNGTGHTIVIARAGCGKTSNLVEGVKYIPKRKKTLFVSFNKDIAVELDQRINKSYIECRTLHSIGFAAVRNAFGKKVALDP